MSKYDFSVPEPKDNEKQSIDGFIKNSSKKKSSSGFWKTVPLLISTVIIILTIALIWTDIKLTDFISLKFAADLLAFLLLFYMMFFTMQDAGNRSGRSDTDYVKVRNEYLTERNKVRNEGAELDIPEFCEFYVRKELHDLRSRILLNANIRYESWEREYGDLDELALLVPLKSKKFEKELQGDRISAENIEKLREIRKMSPRKRAAIVKACLVKPLDISPDLMMLDDGERTSRSPIAEKSIKQKQRQRDIYALIRITVMMFCSISITGTVVVDMSIATLIFGLVKLVSLVITGYNGYATGFTTYTEYGVRRLNDQINLFAVFWKWREEILKKPLSKPQNTENNEKVV